MKFRLLRNFQNKSFFQTIYFFFLIDSSLNKKLIYRLLACRSLAYYVKLPRAIRFLFTHNWIPALKFLLNFYLFLFSYTFLFVEDSIREKVAITLELYSFCTLNGFHSAVFGALKL